MGSFQKRIRLIFSRMNLSRRLIMFFTLVIVFSVSLSNIMVMSYSKKRMLALSNELIGNTLEQVSKNVNEVLITRIYALSDLLMQDDEVYEMLGNNYDPLTDPMREDFNLKKEREIDQVLFAQKISHKYLTPFDGIQIAALCGKNGEIMSISYSNEFSQAALVKIDDFVQKCRLSNMVIHFEPLQENLFDRGRVVEKREQLVVLAGRSLIKPGTHEYFGAVIFAIPERIIYNAYSNIQLGKTGEILIYRTTGELISCFDETKLDKLMLDDKYIELLKSETSGVKHLTENGRRVLWVMKPLAEKDWFVAGKVPVNEISEEVNVLWGITVTMIAIAIIVSLLFISVLVESIIKPIKRIINAMKQAEAGNLQVAAEVAGQYEISEIARYFNRMISRIRKLNEIEKKKKEAELNVLMGQINPHFLYNTLESIVWKAQAAGESEISQMAYSLGRLYRTSTNSRMLQVKVAEELEYVKTYIEIQKLRYKNRFAYEVFVEDESLPACFTLRMILQPIVENAVSHGVKPTKRKVRILLEVKKIHQNLVFTITDNGAGMTTDELQKIKMKLNSNDAGEDQPPRPKKPSGIGLTNINERIKLYFGEQYGLSIESEKNVGTKVTVNVPLIYDSESCF